MLDPESQIYYRNIIGRDDFIRIEPLEDQMQFMMMHDMKDSEGSMNNSMLYEEQRDALKEEFYERNIREFGKITQLLVLPNFSWTFVGEADSYRRRPFPLKFLQYECSDYPCYVFTSELSKAFNSIGDIQTEVDLSEYANTLSIRHPRQDKYEYKEKESLVTSTKEFIKNILR